MMDLVFCGTPLFAVPTLEKLVAAGLPREAGRHPARPPKRSRHGTGSLAGETSGARTRSADHCSRRRSRTTKNFVGNWPSIAPEAIIVVGYGRIIPQWMIDLPPLGNINLHGSLLPKYRGAAPIQWAIAMGETITGVTTMRIDAGLDTGDILLQAEERIKPEDTAVTLAPRLAQTGAELMISTLAGLKNGSITPRPQDDSQATLAPILKREDGLIDFSHTATDAWNRLRGFQPWPGAFTKFRGKILHIHAAVPAPEVAVVAPGHFAVENDRLLLGFAHGTALDVQELQVEGKKRMSARDFINGYRPKSEEEAGQS